MSCRFLLKTKRKQYARSYKHQNLWLGFYLVPPSRSPADEHNPFHLRCVFYALCWPQKVQPLLLHFRMPPFANMNNLYRCADPSGSSQRVDSWISHRRFGVKWSLHLHYLRNYLRLWSSHTNKCTFCQKWHSFKIYIKNHYDLLLHFIIVVPCILILGWRTPTRCNSMQIFIYCEITLHVSGLHRANHQEYIKI